MGSKPPPRGCNGTPPAGAPRGRRAARGQARHIKLGFYSEYISHPLRGFAFLRCFFPRSVTLEEGAGTTRPSFVCPQPGAAGGARVTGAVKGGTAAVPQREGRHRRCSGAEPPRSRLPPSSRERGPDLLAPLPAAIYRASPGRPPLACAAPAAPPAAPRCPPVPWELLRCAARPVPPHRPRNPRPPLSKGRYRPRLRRSKWRPRSGTRLRTASPPLPRPRARARPDPAQRGPRAPAGGTVRPPSPPGGPRRRSARSARSPSPLTASLSRTPGSASRQPLAPGRTRLLPHSRAVRRAHTCAAPTGSGASGPRDYRDTRAARRSHPPGRLPRTRDLRGEGGGWERRRVRGRGGGVPTVPSLRLLLR